MVLLNEQLVVEDGKGHLYFENATFRIDNGSCQPIPVLKSREHRCFDGDGGVSRTSDGDGLLLYEDNHRSNKLITVLARLKKMLRTGEHLDFFLTHQGQIRRRQPVYSEFKRCENDDFTV